LIAFFAVKISSKPADEEHPFGHGKMENISGAVEAFLIFLAALWIIWEAWKKIVNPELMALASWGVLVMFASSLVNIIVSRMLFKVGKETNSLALIADGWHLLTDVYTSAGVMFSLAIIWIGEKMFPHVELHWLDPIAAVAVAMMIIKAAFKLTGEALRDLMDVRLPTEEEKWIKEYISSFKPVVRAFHMLRTRKAGSNRFIEFHLLVKSDMSVEESHQITDIIAEEIEKRYPNSSVTIHIEPCDGKCTPHCESDCLMSEEERKEEKKMAEAQNKGTKTPFE